MAHSGSLSWTEWCSRQSHNVRSRWTRSRRHKRSCSIIAARLEIIVWVNPSVVRTATLFQFGQNATAHGLRIRQLDRAIELTPNLALAFAYRAAVHVRCERHQDALFDAAINLRLSPRDRHAWFAEMISAQAHFAMKDLDSAIEHATRVATLLPSNQVNLRVLIAALVESGRLDDAQTFARPLMPTGELDLTWIATSPWPKSTLGRIEAALSRLASTLRDVNTQGSANKS